MTGLDLGTAYDVEVLDRKYNRATFTCGVAVLDQYLSRQAMQDMRRRVATVFVAMERGSGELHGFYTLSMSSVLLDRLPNELVRKMPRYPSVPAVRLGRLAVHRDVRGRGLGTYLLMDAMARSLRTEVAWAAFLVDAKDEHAREFYLQFGFQSFSDDQNHLSVMRRTIEPLFANLPHSRLE